MVCLIEKKNSRGRYPFIRFGWKAHFDYVESALRSCTGKVLLFTIFSEWIKKGIKWIKSYFIKYDKFDKRLNKNGYFFNLNEFYVRI